MKKTIEYHYVIDRRMFSIISVLSVISSVKSMPLMLTRPWYRRRAVKHSTPPATKNAEKWKKFFPRFVDVAPCIIKRKKFLI